MSEVCMFSLTIREITGKFMETIKEKYCKVQVKNLSILLNIYYFRSIFQGISLRLKQFVVAA